MKWKDHRRLIGVATQRHPVSPFTYKGLMEGVVYPDKTNSWRDKHGIRLESHHHPDTNKIIKLIWRARRHWLDGKENDAGFQLGQALHYIHDSLVSKGFLGWSHDSNENEINTLNINANALYAGIVDSNCDPFYVEKLVHYSSPQSPEKALEIASYITASLIKAVLNHQAMPPELEEEYAYAKMQHSNYLKAGIGAGFATLLIAVFINSMQLILLAPILGFITVKMDSGYYRIEKIWHWFLPTNRHQNYSVNISSQPEKHNAINQGLQNLLPEKKGNSWTERLNAIKKSYPRAYESWSKNEEMELEKLFKENMPHSEIAKKLGRQPSAIRSRLMRLGLIKKDSTNYERKD